MTYTSKPCIAYTSKPQKEKHLVIQYTASSHSASGFKPSRPTVLMQCACERHHTALSVLQVFMMPGAIFINVLAGSLYGLWGTFCVIACVSTLGAGLNYWLSRLLVRVSCILGVLLLCLGVLHFTSNVLLPGVQTLAFAVATKLWC